MGFGEIDDTIIPKGFLGSTWFYLVFLGFAGSYRLLLGFYWFLPSFFWFFIDFSGFYTILLGFTGFYWVLQGNCSRQPMMTYFSRRVGGNSMGLVIEKGSSRERLRGNRR